MKLVKAVLVSRLPQHRGGAGGIGESQCPGVSAAVEVRASCGPQVSGELGGESR